MDEGFARIVFVRRPTLGATAALRLDSTVRLHWCERSEWQCPRTTGPGTTTASSTKGLFVMPFDLLAD
ncbi:hypothetical protein [Rhodococcus sp. USK13]|uniref:hypothetical protein n=1 Tax=Rhodococcus sp. USK13 TaxID=2806442 RepID=UPI001BCD7C56|nr:hypothetical protein [Rhodococcus sp. USK13]